jgi:hypothetical protein
LDRNVTIFRWAFFTVLLGLLPILLTATARGVLGKSVTDWQLLGRGDLLLVSTAIAATAIGDLFVLLRPARALRDLSTQLQLASSILVVAVATYLFAFPQIAEAVGSLPGGGRLELAQSEYLLANYACLATALVLALTTILRTSTR